VSIPPLSEWSEELKYRYEERAGIREFEGGTPRARAEQEALKEVWAAHVRETK
jgi:hypothetical protein